MIAFRTASFSRASQFLPPLSSKSNSRPFSSSSSSSSSQTKTKTNTKNETFSYLLSHLSPESQGVVLRKYKSSHLPPNPPNTPPTTIPSSFDSSYFNLLTSQLPLPLSTELKTSLEATIDFHTSRLDSLSSSSSSSSSQSLSWRQRSVQMTKKYGFPFAVYWWGAWFVTLPLCLGLIEVLDVDGLALVNQIDSAARYCGLDADLSSRVDEQHGRYATGFVLNEVLEVVRLPVVLATTPWFAKTFFKK